MTLATRGNVRTAAAAKRNSLPDALRVAFRTGGVAGMFTVGLGLLGATVIIAIFQNTSSAILVGFGFGGSLLALFLRVGGGIFTKAADVGADLVGKVEAGIPEDDPRNPATIADNVGDNVGDCAGMASDLFESYEVTLVAAIILGVPAFAAVGPTRPSASCSRWPPGPSACIASIFGVYAVKAKEGETDALKPINRGFLTAGIITVIGVGALALLYVGNRIDGVRRRGRTITNVGWRCFGAVVIGLVLAQGVSRLTEYFTATHHAPVREIAESTRTGPATTILSGTSSGMESSVYAIIAIALAIGVSLALGDGNLQFSLYLVALTGMGMLATTGVIVSEDTFGPVSDNAAGIAEMSGEFHGEPERIMVSLDAVGNTTKAVTKGFAIGSAVIASVAIFASFIETAVDEIIPLELVEAARASSRGVFDLLPINVADPKVFIGLLIGGAVPFLFSALAINAVSRTAGVVVQEVRRQFADGKIMSGEKQPDHGPVIDICTAASLRELVTPALLAVLTPVIIGFGIGFTALGAFLVARHPRGPAHGQLPEQRGWRVGQRQEVHRGRQRGRQGLRRLPGRRHRRHRRRPLQGHRRPGPQPAHQGDEPGVAPRSCRPSSAYGRTSTPVTNIASPNGTSLAIAGRRPRGPDRRHRLLQAEEGSLRWRATRASFAGRHRRRLSRPTLRRDAVPRLRPGPVASGARSRRSTVRGSCTRRASRGGSPRDCGGGRSSGSRSVSLSTLLVVVPAPRLGDGRGGAASAPSTSTWPARRSTARRRPWPPPGSTPPRRSSASRRDAIALGSRPGVRAGPCEPSA